MMYHVFLENVRKNLNDFKFIYISSKFSDVICVLRSLGESGLLNVLGRVASIVRVERMGEEAPFLSTWGLCTWVRSN